MIRSMTGFGRVELSHDTKKFIIDVKSLNSKQLDLNLKTPNELRSIEFDLRNIISQTLLRGKIDVTINIADSQGDKTVRTNENVFKTYYGQAKSLVASLGEDSNREDWPAIIFRMPGIFESEDTVFSEETLDMIRQGVKDAVKFCDDFRAKEGEVLRRDFLLRVDLILSYLDQVKPFEDGRHVSIRERLTKNLSELADSQYDANRLEQELIYYFEKLDITEEKVRLRKHCEYFRECIDEEGAGKKLGFISQEMGREINTLGSKANEANIQRLVVKMKDELEKIKEQLANIL